MDTLRKNLQPLQSLLPKRKLGVTARQMFPFKLRFNQDVSMVSLHSALELLTLTMVKNGIQIFQKGFITGIKLYYPK